MRDIKELSPQELEGVLRRWDKPGFHARQVFSWIYKSAVLDFNQMTNLPLDLRKQLSGHFYILGMKLIRIKKSKDGTEKLLLELKDKNLIEAVIIPEKRRVTGCVSSQAGCKFACGFCASGLSGFKRGLSSEEIIEEVLYLKKLSQNKLTHIVFMGMGEPLANFDEVLKAVRVINSPQGLNIGARRITISTCGIIPGIKKLAGEGLQVELSVSLHASDDKVRSTIMPVNKKYPLKELIHACRQYFEITNRQVTFEYILIDGLNSRLQDAQNLGKLLRGLNCKVNLIPANPLEELNVKPPQKREIALFQESLRKAGINVTLRRARGEDIQGACGQLRLRYV